MSKISANLITKSIYRLIRTFVKSTQQYTVIMKVFLFVSTNFLGFYKMHWSMGSWTRGFKHYRQQSMGKLYFVWFLFSWFKWTTKSVKIRTTRIILISQYMYIRSVFTCRQFHCVHIYLVLASNTDQRYTNNNLLHPIHI